jgi:hypothetical protein
VEGRLITVYCADIGSGKRFGWAFGRPGERPSPGGSQIDDLAAAVAQSLEAGAAVALGFECPLFVPVPRESERLGAKRPGEGNRPWSAGAGAAVLTTGLAQVAWVLEAVRRRVSHDVPVFLRWDCLEPVRPGLLLWEAFVSGRDKAASHVGDAQRAVEFFLDAWPDLGRANIVGGSEVFSLVGAALLRSGWAEDVSVLTTPCLVVGVRREPSADSDSDRAPAHTSGRRNSMRTRVVPMFCELMRRDPTGMTWLSRLLALARRDGQQEEVPLPNGPILEARFGGTERPLEPPRSLLRWLVEHPERLNAPKKGQDQPAKRLRLLSGAARERDEAINLLTRSKVPPREWYVLEGASYPDVFVRTRTGIVVIEGKRTEADVTTKTTWMPVRHQMLRHLDGAWDLREDHRVVGMFIVEGEGGNDAVAVSRSWMDRCAATVKPDVLESSLPHRSAPDRAAIARAYLGVTTWQAVCDALDVSYQRLPDRL